MANRYWVGGTANWDGTAGSKWATSSGGAGGAAVPSSSDDVFFDAASGAAIVTVTAYTGALNINFTGFTGTFAGNSSVNGLSTLILGSGMTYFHTGTLEFSSSGSITSNGIVITSIQIEFVNARTTTLNDDLVITGSSGLIFTQGTFDANGFNITGKLVDVSNSNVRTLNMGSGTWTITSTAGWNATTSSNLTLNASTSTIKFTAAGTSAFSTGGKTYNNIWFTGTGQLSIIAGATFNDFKSDPNVILQFTAGQTFTVSTFTVNGTYGNNIILRSDSGGTPFTLSKSSGTVNCSYLSIQDSTATGGATWNAINSASNGGNTGWNFSSGVVNSGLLSIL